MALGITNRWQKCIPNARIINFYGPTEDTVFCSYYDVNAEFPEPLKLLKDTAFDVVDENGEFVRERLFKAGAEFKIIKSDAKRKVLLKTEDGMIVRVVIDNEEWPLTINGEDAFEIFDNMFFAG